MFYKLSNTSTMLDIEDNFDASFKYPLLYKNEPIINGLSEQLLPIITMHNPNEINFAIWGLMPQNFKESWSSFQQISNTLNISIDDIENLEWIQDLLDQQRCVILVSGFFTAYMHNGEIYPFYVYQENNKPFALAAVYSTLDDGFLSVSVVTSSIENQLKNVHSLGRDFPIVLNSMEHKDWLADEEEFNKKSTKGFNRLRLKAHPISKEFYKNDIVYDSILEPAHYSQLPILSLK